MNTCNQIDDSLSSDINDIEIFDNLLNSPEFSKIYKKILKLFIPTKNGGFSASFSGSVSYVDRAKKLSKIDEQVIRLVGYDVRKYAVWWDGVFENIISQLEDSPNSKMLNSARRVMIDVTEGDNILASVGIFDKITNPEEDAGTVKVITNEKIIKLKYSHKKGKISFKIKGGYETFKTGLSMDPIRRKIEILINIGSVYNDPKFKLAQKDIAKYSLPSVEKLELLKSRKDSISDTKNLISEVEKNSTETLKPKKKIGIIIGVIAATLIALVVILFNMNRNSSSKASESPKDVAAEVETIIKDIDLNRNAGQIMSHYNLSKTAFENNSWTDISSVVVKEVIYSQEHSIRVTTDIKQVWSNGKFNPNAAAASPKEYTIQMYLGYEDNVQDVYNKIYKILAKKFSRGKKVDFEYNGMDILCLFDTNGFKITVGKDLEPIDFDDAFGL